MATTHSRDFWLECWQNGEIGFHQPAVNPRMTRFWPELGIPEHSRVLVPLCGKTEDMIWLRSQQLEVLGVELSELAVESFFKEWSLQPEVSQDGVMKLYYSAGTEDGKNADLTIACGDFFELTPKQLEGVVAVYDRAALVALPPAIRRRYAEALCNWLPESAGMLLVTLEYDMNEMQGPPFSVPDSEVEQLYGEHFEITLQYEDEKVLDRTPHFREEGLTWLTERTYTLVRRT
ncbi:thiopurine S-methyltransferase [Spongorhabdus nitratireducens]